MAKSLAEELGARLSGIESRLNALSGNRLDHASLDGSTLYLKDSDGNLQGRLGRQPDGSNGVHVVRVQPPPQLTAPILTVGDMAGTCQVEWDGGTFDGRRMPLIHGHTEIWAEDVAEDWEPTVAPGDTAKRVGTIRDRTGGTALVALPTPGFKALWLRAMGADRETAGPWSPVSQVEITPLVDTEQMEQDLQDARDRITEADERLTQGQETLTGHLATLGDRQDSLQEDLTTGLQSVHYEAEQMAEAARDNAVNQAAANAQSEYDRLQEIAERALSRAGDNVLEDPSFETPYWFNMSWTSGYEANVSHTPRTGDQALALTRVADNTLSYNVYFDTIDVEPDDSWRFSVWYRSEGSPDFDSSAWGTRLQIRDQDNNTVVFSPTFEVADEYMRAVVTYQVPEGVTQLRPNLLMTWRNEGTLILDDIAFQEVGAAAEALRLAEVARQEAEAAHIAAGNAVDAAANAYDAAAGKSTIHWSLSAPSGTGNPGDVWWQYETNSSRRTVIGEWHWENGVWREADIAEERLPLVDIGTGTYGDLHGDRLTANTVQAQALAVMPDAQDFAPRSEDLWAFSNGFFDAHGSSTTGRAVRITNTTGQALIRGPRLPVTPGQSILIRAFSSWYGSANIGTATHLRMEWYDSADGDRLSFTTVISVEDGTGGHEVEGTVTVPEDASYANFYIFQTAANGPGDRALMDFTVRTQTPGVLIQDGAVKSRSVDTEEFFAAEAVIQKIWTEIVRARMVETEGLITEDMIATGAVTTPKLTVTEEMVAEVVKVMRLEGDEMDFNVIRGMIIEAAEIQGSIFLATDADGNETVRLDGMDNFLRGSIHAGVGESAEIRLDYGTKIRRSGVDEEGEPDTVRSIETPYLNFQSGDDYQPDQEPAIYIDRGDHDGDGQMIINPGYPVGTPVYRGRLNVVGDVVSNQMRPRERLQINTSHEDQPGVIQAVGQSIRIRGQTPALTHSQEMFYTGQTDQASLAPGGLRKRTINWGVPVPRGRRDPIATAYVQGASSNNNAYIVVNVSQRFQTSYRLDEYNPSSATANYWVGVIAPWRDV